MKKIKYLGVSKGKVNDCLSCENCGDLEEGIKSFDIDGLYNCEYCVANDYTPAQIEKAINSPRMLCFGRRPASEKRFDYLMVRLDSPFGYQHCNFYVSKADPLFNDFLEACKRQLLWRSEEYSTGLLRMEYCYKDEAEESFSEGNGNYRCSGGYLAEANLVKALIHPKEILIDEKKRKTYGIKKFEHFGDVIGKDFAWFCDKAQCFKL